MIRLPELAPLAPTAGAALGAFLAHVVKRVPSAAQVRDLIREEIATLATRMERVESWLKIPPYRAELDA